MAPEMLDDAATHLRSLAVDIYSLGVVVGEFCARKPPRGIPPAYSAEDVVAGAVEDMGVKVASFLGDLFEEATADDPTVGAEAGVRLGSDCSFGLCVRFVGWVVWGLRVVGGCGV